MQPVDLNRAIGGTDGCRRLAEAFYRRVERDPVLRPLFPGKTLRCATDAFSAFLSQFLGGPAEAAEDRWYLSLRESHSRLKIGERERDAWIARMLEALDEAVADEPVRIALRRLFEHSSAYLINKDHAATAPENAIQSEVATRWDEQRETDDLVAAISAGDAAGALRHATHLAPRFARDRAVFAHVLGLMIASRDDALIEYVERELTADPALARVRNRYGRTLFHDASAHANLRIVELLLNQGADPNVRTAGGHTPLYCIGNECAVAPAADVIRALVQAGADVDAISDSKRCTPLHMAARRGNLDVAKALLDAGANINAKDRSGDTPLRRAKNCRKPEVAKLLAARGAHE